MGAMTAREADALLAGLDGWKRDGDEISRQFVFASFAGSMSFVNVVAEAAESADHHPDILITYNRVTLTLSTHSEGGLTQKDFALAGRIDAIGHG